MFEFANALVLMLLGAMLFFPSVVAPVVFTSLPEAQAGAFLRSMFPRYYVFMIALSLIAALLSWRSMVNPLTKPPSFASSCPYQRFG